MKIKISKTTTTENDEILRTLIGSTWNTDRVYPNYIIIDCCGGIKLLTGEYEKVRQYVGGSMKILRHKRGD